jgi:hypothetical protein
VKYSEWEAQRKAGQIKMSDEDLMRVAPVAREFLRSLHEASGVTKSIPSDGVLAKRIREQLGKRYPLHVLQNEDKGRLVLEKAVGPNDRRVVQLAKERALGAQLVESSSASAPYGFAYIVNGGGAGRSALLPRACATRCSASRSAAWRSALSRSPNPAAP